MDLVECAEYCKPFCFVFIFLTALSLGFTVRVNPKEQIAKLQN